MNKLKERILADGVAVSDTVLIVDSFLNHQMDPVLMDEMGKAFAAYFEKHQITKIFTIESSGIAPAIFTALYMGLDLVTLKKSTSKILSDEVAQTTVHSYTKDINYELTLKKKYINPNDKILIIDDFLANGEAVLGTARLIEAAGATVAGVGIVIEKSFQDGRDKIEAKGYDIYSLARLKKLSKAQIEFI